MSEINTHGLVVDFGSSRSDDSGRTQVKAACTGCGAPTWKFPCQVRRRKPYCSRHCAQTANGKLRRPTRLDAHPRWKGGVSLNRARWQQLMRARYPEKASARAKVKYALSIGRLVRQPCEVCGNTEVHAHHDDYSKPLSVRWLCRQHHDAAHRTVMPA